MEGQQEKSLYQKGNVVYVGQYQQLPVHLGNYALPYPFVTQQIEERHKNLEKTQKNNHLVALSVLKSSVVSFLQFERSFKSLLSKGDDNTQIAIIKYAISELRSANQSYDSLMEKNDPFLPFITEPDRIVDVRELFEHCIKVLSLMLHLLGGRDIKTNAHEFIAQSYSSWVGWKQTSEQIMLSNNVLSLLVKHSRALRTAEVFVDEHYAMIAKEVGLFTSSVSHVTDCIFESRYPDKGAILKIYEDAGCDIQKYMHLHNSGATTTKPLDGKVMSNNNTKKTPLLPQKESDTPTPPNITSWF